MKAVLWIMSAGLLFAGVGCKKKGNDDLKNKAVAIRDKALACTDAKCASAASDEYVALTKDLSGLSDTDAKLIGDMMVEVRTIAVKLESAPAPAPAAPATPPPAPPAGDPPAAGGGRTMAPGFSVALPDGWQVRPSKDPSTLLMASKGTSMADGSMLSVADVKQAIDISSEDACKARGAEQAKGMDGELVHAMLLDLPAGSSCVVDVRSAKREIVAAFIPRAAKDTYFYVLCSIVADDKAAKMGCGEIFASWKLEP